VTYPVSINLFLFVFVEVNFMWAAHQVHHSSEDYNFTTALRQSVLQMYTSWVCLVFLLTIISAEPTIIRTRGEHANHCTTDAVIFA
jgi:sterol desaturase/sphingolipid hydroxylase (fatty acid hydroxylase superfamily)